MAIATLDAVVAGFKAPVPLYKVTGTMEAAGVLHTTRYAGGLPPASAAPAPGVNGQAVTAASYAGGISRSNPASGNAYLGSLVAAATVLGTLVLIDRLWDNSGLSVTSTAAQAITPAALPDRDADGAALGAGVEAAVEWSAAGGAGTPTVTLTYTAADGTTLRTATMVGQATPVAGTFEAFTGYTGRGGVRAPTSFQQSATRTSGTMHLVLFRRLAALPVSAANVAAAIDALTSGMPRVFDNACLELLWLPVGTGTGTIHGQYVETQG